MKDWEIADVGWRDEGLGYWRCGHEKVGRLEMGDKVLGRFEMWSCEDEAEERLRCGDESWWEIGGERAGDWRCGDEG